VRAVVAELSARTSRLPGQTRPPTLTSREEIRPRITAESWTPSTVFNVGLRDELAALLEGAPVLPTGAGHDAGILAAAGVPSAMLFVRNPTGVSHSPDEHAERDDCLAGVESLVRVISGATRP
jgi:beta-ureidopropionase / N-carbamoyl-L-amino-acid hydrolase